MSGEDDRHDEQPTGGIIPKLEKRIAELEALDFDEGERIVIGDAINCAPSSAVQAADFVLHVMRDLITQRNFRVNHKTQPSRIP